MKQPRIRKQRANFQRAKRKMFQKQRKGQSAKCFKSKGKGQRGKKQYKKGKKTAFVLAKQKYASFWQSKLK